MNVYDVLTRLHKEADNYDDYELAEFVDYVRELERSKNKIRVKLDDTTDIVAELNDWSDDEPVEICICLQDNYGIATQDVCLVRPENGYEHTTEVLVWGNPNDEDYTYKVSINKYMED